MWTVKYVENGRLTGRVVLKEEFGDGKFQVIASICDGGWLKTHKGALISEEQTKQMWKFWMLYAI